MNQASPHGQQARLEAALNALTDHDSRWRVSPTPGCVTASRDWPDGSVDTLVILAPQTGYGTREDARRRLVWSVTGTVEQLVVAARDLAAPFAPGAPSEPVAEYRRDRLT